MATYHSEFQKLYLVAEVTDGTPGASAATQGFLHAKFDADVGQERLQPSTHASHRGERAVILGRRRPVVAFSSDIAMSGTAGVAPDLEPLLLSVFAETTTTQTAIEASPSPTTTGCTITTAGAVATGDLVGITVAGSVYGVRITGNTAGAITWLPALPAAPSSTSVIKASRNYTLQTAPTGTATAHLVLDSIVAETISGLYCKDLTLSGDNAGLAKFDSTLWGKDISLVAPFVVNEAIDISETELDITPATGYNAWLSSEEGGVQAFWIEVEPGVAAAEVMKVTAFNASTNKITVVRGQCGTAAAVHADLTNTAYIYAPTQTGMNDNPAVCTRGRTYFDTWEIDCYNWSFKVDDGVERREPFGDETAIGRVFGKRTISCDLEYTMETDDLGAVIGNGMNALSAGRPLYHVLGDVDGKCMMIYCPAIEQVTPKFPTDKTELMQKTTFRCLPSASTGNDEIRIALF